MDARDPQQQLLCSKEKTVSGFYYSISKIKDNSGASSLAMAMFFALILGFFSVSSMNGIKGMMANSKYTEAQALRSALKSEVTLLLSNPNTCKNALNFEIGTGSNTEMIGVIRSLDFPDKPGGSTRPLIEADEQGIKKYNNLTIKSIVIKPIKSINTLSGRSYLSNIALTYTSSGGSRDISAVIPTYFTVDQTKVGTKPLNEIITGCFATQSTINCSSGVPCRTWHDQPCSYSGLRSGTNLVFDPITRICKETI